MKQIKDYFYIDASSDLAKDVFVIIFAKCTYTEQV